jgi:hypothetical protein
LIFRSHVDAATFKLVNLRFERSLVELELVDVDVPHRILTSLDDGRREYPRLSPVSLVTIMRQQRRAFR